MGLLDMFRPKTAMHEKIIYTQKSRISGLEKDIEEMKQALRMRDSELKEVRTTSKRKDRLVDQIIDLSDKFAEVNDVVAKVHTENGRLKSLVESKEHCLSTRTAERSASRTSADHL